MGICTAKTPIELHGHAKRIVTIPKQKITLGKDLEAQRVYHLQLEEPPVDPKGG